MYKNNFKKNKKHNYHNNILYIISSISSIDKKINFSFSIILLKIILWLFDNCTKQMQSSCVYKVQGHLYITNK